jgi:hypothetical protein
MNYPETELDELHPPLSDREIFDFAQRVLEDIDSDRGRLSVTPARRASRTPSGLRMLAVFLLGMTCMEGLRVLVPGSPASRGGENVPAYRCRGLEVATPANPVSRQVVAGDQTFP